MSPSVVTPDWYRPDNDAAEVGREGGKKNDTQSSSRSALPKVAFQLPHQHMPAVKHEKKKLLRSLAFAGREEMFLFPIILIIPGIAEQKNNSNNNTKTAVVIPPLRSSSYHRLPAWRRAA